VGGDREGRDRLAGRRVAHLGVARQAPDQLRPVQGAHAFSSSAAAGAAGGSSSTTAAGAAAGSGAGATGVAGTARAATLSGLPTARCLKTGYEIFSVESIS